MERSRKKRIGARELESLEEYFQTVVQYLPGGMAVIRHRVGGEVRPEYLSDGFAEMLDMSQEEVWNVYRTDAMAGVHPEDRAHVGEELSRCIREELDKSELQYRLQKKGGSYIWVRTKFSVVRCEGGDVRVYVDYHDITVEKEMQDRLRKQYQEQIRQHYLLAGPDALVLGHCNITQDRIHEVVDYTDSGLLERFGTVREEFFTGLGTLIPDPDERAAFYSKYLNGPALRAYLAGEQEISMSCFVQFPQGKAGRYVQFKVILVETPDTGDVTGILTATDVTEDRIRDQIFMHLSSISYDLVADVDLFADYYEIVSGGDDNICQVRGSNSQRIEQVIRDSVINDQRERDYVAAMLEPAAMLERLREQKSYSFTYSVCNDHGEVRAKNMTVSAIDLRLGRVCFVRSDVTDVLAAERKAKEELERALREAEKADRAKSDFLSSMSHDIRTPMNAIVGMTTLALANLGDSGKVKDYLHKIAVSSQHLLSLINDILDMSQIEQSKLRLDLQSLHVEELVDYIASIMTAQADSLGLRFQIEPGPFQHPCFLGDALRIKQILINLLSNAFKFTQEGGTVRFATQEIAPRQPDRIRYRFTVEDSGIGMSQQILEHLFDPFVRSQRVARVEGTGLGLSITKGLVELMEGEIQVSSSMGEGTCFQVELEFDPAKEPVGQLTDPQEVQTGDMSGLHFLLVEDNAINSQILGELLQMWGATFTLKTDGAQAVEEFRQTAPGTYDAIFMDVQMPVMDGIAATRAIRQLDRPDAKQIAILAMTANAFAQDVQACLDAGMDGHIAKPVDMRLLYQTIVSLLKK